jgi:hypothetical protein
MFNKLKMAIPGGNKKQRQKVDEEQKADEVFAIKLVKLELSEGRMVSPFIKNSTDHNEFPSFIKREVLYRPKKMTDDERNAKEMFLRQYGVETKYTEDTEGNKHVHFSKIEKKEEATGPKESI